jgi:lipopolysaccharide export LptBFGC system permease protein LptF
LRAKDLTSLTDPELAQQYKRNGRRYWRVFLPSLVSFFALFGVAFGVRAAFGMVPALVVFGVAIIIMFAGIVGMFILVFSQNRIRMEVWRRARRGRDGATDRRAG